MKNYTSDDLNYWEIKSNTNTLNVKTICMEIENGKKKVGGINIEPTYQREYKFSKKDESALIESLLAGIPIPIIYLASDSTKTPYISNVIDGHHRLKAIYRFVNDNFSLLGLTKYSFLNGCLFSELDPSIQNKLLYQVSLTFQFIHIQDDPELEYEIFTRYNKGTHQLTPQEIRNVVYRSSFIDWLNEYTDIIAKDTKLSEIYNAKGKRLKDKNIQSEIALIASIFLNGINPKYYSSTEYIVDILKYARKLDEIKVQSLINELEAFFNLLNKLILEISEEQNIKNPFSKELYKKIEKRNHKFQISIVMILVAFLSLFKSEIKKYSSNEIYEAVKSGIILSGFDKITSSTTEPTLLLNTVNRIITEIKK